MHYTRFEWALGILCSIQSVIIIFILRIIFAGALENIQLGLVMLVLLLLAMSIPWYLLYLNKRTNKKMDVLILKKK